MSFQHKVVICSAPCGWCPQLPTKIFRNSFQIDIRPANRPAFGGTVPLFYQMSCVPLNHGNVPLFVRSLIFFARAQFVTLPRCPDVQITQLNAITEILFDFSQKYQTVPRPNRRATVYFVTQLISVGCILLNKILMWALPTVPLFYAKCPSKNILQVGRSVTSIKNEAW